MIIRMLFKYYSIFREVYIVRLSVKINFLIFILFVLEFDGVVYSLVEYVCWK